MLVMFTKLYLKREVTEQQVRELILKWVLGSPHFHFTNLQEKLVKRENEDEGIESDEKEQKFYSLRYNNEDVVVQAYKLENRDNKVLWSTECVFVQRKQEQYITVSLSCDLQEYNSRLPYKHKPYIVRMLVESGYCLEDGKLAITDRPILVSDDNISDVIGIMNAEADNYMPLVYVSKNYNDYAVDIDKLAIWLSGIAHVVVEQEKEWSYKLKESTNSRNAHNGFIGIYYPQNRSYDLFAKSSYINSKEMGIDISCSVQQALVNYEDSQEYNWNRIVFARTVDKWKAEGDKKSAELNEFINSFQPLNDALNEKVRSLNAQLEIYKAMISSSREEGNLLNSGTEKEFYIGEKKDLLLTLLHNVKEKMQEDTRSYELLCSILEANEYDGYGKKILEELKTIMHSIGKLNSSVKADLKHIGFDVIVEKGHPKLIFHENEKYKFPISGTPGSNRDGKNLYGDISGKIDIYKKPF